MITDLARGAGYLLTGAVLITRPRLRRFVVVPALVNVLLFAAVLWFGAGSLASLTTAWLPDWLDFLVWLVVPLFVVAVLFVGFYAFSLLANLIAAPFNGLLAAAVERRLRGTQPGRIGSWSGLFQAVLAELWLAVRSELAKLAYTLPRLALLLLLSLLLPVVGPLLSLIFGAWLLALGYLDYALGNHGMAFPEQRTLMSRHLGLTLGFGAATMAALTIPVLNFVVMPAAVAGAAALVTERLPDELPPSPDDAPAAG